MRPACYWWISGVYAGRGMILLHSGEVGRGLAFLAVAATWAAIARWWPR